MNNIASDLKQIIIISLAGIISVIVALFLISSLNLSIPLFVNQITTSKNDYFSVEAEGKAYAIPDIAVVNIGFTTQGATVKQVQDQANEITEKITSDLTNLGINEGDIKTTNYSIYPNYNYTNGKQTLNGYTINISMQIKARQLEKGSQVIDIATKDGANNISGISFQVDDMEKYRNQARKEAIDKAKQKAQEIAKETGLTLGKIINVYETPPDQVPGPYYGPAKADGLGAGEQIPTQLQPGQTEVIVSVTLGYQTK